MMHRFAISLILVGALTCTLNSIASIAAQESTPVAQEVVITPAIVATLDELPALPAIVGLARWTYQPGATMRIDLSGPEIYVVESGSLTFTVDGSVEVVRASQPATPIANESTTAGRQVVLGPGDQISIPPRTTHDMTNESDDVAIVLNLVAFPASLAVPSWLPDPDLPTGLSLQNIASAVVNDGPGIVPGAQRITVSTATMPIGTSLPLPAAEAGFVAVVSGTMSWQTATMTGTYRAPDVAFLTSGEVATVANAGHEALVVQIVIVTSVADAVSSIEIRRTFD